jgi:predicted DNA-binding ribbon-helix-helix protein
MKFRAKVQVDLEPNFYTRIKTLAEASDLTVAETVRRLLAQAIFDAKPLLPYDEGKF